MRSAATIETGNVIVIGSPSAIFPLDGSITTPLASGFAFDASSPCSSSRAKLAPAMAIARTQTRKGMNRRHGESANRRNVGGASVPRRVAALRRLPHLQNCWFIIFVVPVVGSGVDRHQL